MLLRSGLIAFGLLTAPTSVQTTAISYDAEAVIVPVHDPIAEAKANGEDARVVDIIQAINRYVNARIEGASDSEHYGLDDYWVQYPTDGKGDCEDYALTKLGMLGQVGVPVVNATKLVSVIVHVGSEADGHETLAIRLPHGTVLYLDNLNRELMTRQEFVAEGYEFFDWKA